MSDLTRTTSVAKYVPQSAIRKVQLSRSRSKTSSSTVTAHDDIDSVSGPVEVMDMKRPRKRLRGGQLEPWPPAEKFRESFGPYFFRRFEMCKRQKCLVGLLPAERAILESIGSYFLETDPETGLNLLESWVVPLNDEDPSMPALRTMDWAVTNYFKKHTVTIRDPRSPDGRMLDPHSAYNTTLDFWHRLLFDPFRRGNHIWFQTKDGEYKYTTAGQLNFLKWLKDTTIDKLIATHEHHIIVHRNHGFKASRMRSKKYKEENLPRRRSELTQVNPVAAKAFVKCDK